VLSFGVCCVVVVVRRSSVGREQQTDRERKLRSEPGSSLRLQQVSFETIFFLSFCYRSFESMFGLFWTV
jgi:hypothetical protein